MLNTVVHVLPGLIALAAASLIVFALGGPRHRRVMIAVLVCWLGGTLGQVLTGRLIAPAIAADVVFALWLLWFATRATSWWVYTLFGLQACGIVLHGARFAGALGPDFPYRTSLNTLSLAALAVLALAAVLDWRARRRR
jgi:CBS domain containing-hemolysin-like protein